MYNYSEVLQLLRQGKRMYRKAWSGTNRFIFILPGSVIRVQIAEILAEKNAQVTDSIFIRSRSGTIGPFSVTTCDQMANDWVIKE